GRERWTVSWILESLCSQGNRAREADVRGRPRRAGEFGSSLAGDGMQEIANDERADKYSYRKGRTGQPVCGDRAQGRHQLPETLYQETHRSVDEPGAVACRQCRRHLRYAEQSERVRFEGGADAQHGPGYAAQSLYGTVRHVAV